MDKFCDVVNGDCFLLMEKLEENSIDLVVTDPPYVLNTVGRSGGGFKSAKLYETDGFREICNGYDVSRFLELCSLVLKKMNAFVFCSNAQWWIF